MTRHALSALALAAGLAAATPALAFDIDAMSEQERAIFRDEVRAYLLDNPEVIMEAVAVLEQRQADQQVADDAALIATNHDALFDDGFSHVAGNPDGDITIVEFVDYKCGYCRKAFPEVAQLLTDDGNIRLILKEFPILGEESLLASRFAIAAKLVDGDEAYGKLHDAMMTMRGTMTPDSLSGLAGSLGLDGAAIVAGMTDPAVDLIIGQNHGLAGRLQINGTPAFVMGDEMLRGYIPLDGMVQIVDKLRAQKG